MSASTDLTFALYHAIAYLTRSLIGRYSATTIDLLHFTLERNLAKQYETNWFPADSQRGSGRRCLTLSPIGAPPRPIYYACKSARVNWEDWMACLGGVEMDLFIDPGLVSVRFGKSGAGGVNKLYIVWSAKAGGMSAEAASGRTQTIAQSIIDEDEDELFNMIADEIRAPTWMTPILNQFPNVPRPTVTIASPPRAVVNAEEPDSAVSTSSTHSSLLSVATRHSRSSSHSSDTSSSGFSFASADTAATSVSASSCNQRPVSSRTNSATTCTRNPVLLPAATLIMQAPVSFEDEDELDGSSTPTTTPNSKVWRRDRARQARVHIDATKNEVTPYDGGKTTVLTGGVMLGMRATTSTPTSASPSTARFVATPSAAGRNTTWKNASAAVVTLPCVRA